MPEVNDAVHVLPQLIPEGAEVTVPDPAPLFVTVSVFGVGATISKVAVTLLSLSIVTVQVPPVHAPDQPAKIEPEDGVAVSVT